MMIQGLISRIWKLNRKIMAKLYPIISMGWENPGVQTSMSISSVMVEISYHLVVIWFEPEMLEPGSR